MGQGGINHRNTVLFFFLKRNKLICLAGVLASNSGSFTGRRYHGKTLAFKKHFTGSLKRRHV